MYWYTENRTKRHGEFYPLLSIHKSTLTSQSTTGYHAVLYFV